MKKSTTPPTYKGLGRESVAPEIVARFAPKPADPKLARKIQLMIDIKSPDGPALTPDGKHMFFNWSITGTTQIWRSLGPLQFPVQMTGGNARTSISAMAPNGKFILVSRDYDGEENPGIYWMPVEGGELQEIQHKKNVRSGLNYVSDDSSWILFSANDIKPDSYAIYRYHFATKKRELIFDQPGTWVIEDVKDEHLLLLSKARTSHATEVYLYDLNAPKLIPLFGQDEEEDYSVQFGANPNEYIVTTQKFDDFGRVYSYQNGKWNPITPERKAEISSAYIDRERQRIYINRNEGGYSRAEVLDAKTKKSLPLPSFSEADHIWVGGATRNARFVVISVQTAQAPTYNYVYDWQTQRHALWQLPSVPETDTRRFVRASLESYPARDGTPIPMFVRRAKGCYEKGSATNTAACPVLVIFHGGPEGQSTPGFSPSHQLFIDEGFTIVEPNVRGSTGYGKKWLDSDNGAKRLQVITDIEDVARHIRRTWTTNGVAPKIGALGGSYGGYSVFMAMSRFAGAFDAGVAKVGPSDLISFLNNTAPYRRHLRTSEYGDPEKDRDALIALSPVTYADQVKGPLLITQGLNDPRIPAGESLQMEERLRKRGVPVELIIYPDEGHGNTKRENRVLDASATLLFLNKHLKTQTPALSDR